jgi:hypothetical protein
MFTTVYHHIVSHYANFSLGPFVPMRSYSQGMPPYLVVWLILCSMRPHRYESAASMPIADSSAVFEIYLKCFKFMGTYVDQVPRRGNDCGGSIVEFRSKAVDTNHVSQTSRRFRRQDRAALALMEAIKSIKRLSTHLLTQYLNDPIEYD